MATHANSRTMADMDVACVAVLGTCDTKLEELLYVRDKLIRAHNVRVTLIDVGRMPSVHPDVTIGQSSILSMSPSRSGAVMRALPFGFPKLLVSTMAAGDVSPYVGETDVAMLYSVVDIAGLNDILCPILDNAAGAIAGMAQAYHARVVADTTLQVGRRDEDIDHERGSRRGKRIAITMFGVTTPAVTCARELLTRYACTPYVFHATGAGGRAMERLAAGGFFDGVLDITTTELADELVGGVLSAGPHRLEAAARAGVPQVVSLGALDMVNFGPRATVPEKFSAHGRKLYEHNSSITLMRTTREECAQLGRTIVEKLRAAGARPEKTEVWIPRGGVSVLDADGEPFWDPEADEALASGVKSVLEEGGATCIRVVERKEGINDLVFVEGMVHSLVRMMDLEPIREDRCEDAK
ncbi:hypothetical protein C8Q79DRAFT_25341 [Trametes meyenii]|nr:hypothetical protein C8Q79DRAFT_25341 [Trametes meyenii]